MNHPVDISALKSIKATAEAAALVHFPQPDGSRVPYAVFSSQEVFEREQERIYRGPTWSTGRAPGALTALLMWKPFRSGATRAASGASGASSTITAAPMRAVPR